MKQLSPKKAFEALIATMESDNGCPFPYTPRQRAHGAALIQEMMNAGLDFPDDPDVFQDINGVYWELAAGEEYEREAKYGGISGYRGLNDLLNQIFDAPR